MAKINQAAMSRQEQARERRLPFFLYIDEFHNFVTPSIGSILSGARKYGLGLTLAHQETRQLRSRSEDVAAAVFGNAYARVVFRVGEQDARTLADGLSFFEPNDLLNLGVGEAIARVEQAAFEFNLRVTKPDSVQESLAEYRRTQSISESRRHFATPRALVGEALRTAVPTPETARDTTVKARLKYSPTVEVRRSAPTRVTEPVIKQVASTDRVRAVPQPGRGGAQHKYLQSLIRRAAEGRGFRATIEHTVLDGHGHIDVLLETTGVSIGCEISISTDVEHEVANISKCLAAGWTALRWSRRTRRSSTPLNRHWAESFPMRSVLVFGF